MANLEMREEVAMPLLSADPVMVSPEHREVVERLVRTRSTPQQLAWRARMILQVGDGMGVGASARELGVWPKTVRYWCTRWRRAADGQPVPERLGGGARGGGAGRVMGRATWGVGGRD